MRQQLLLWLFFSVNLSRPFCVREYPDCLSKLRCRSCVLLACKAAGELKQVTTCKKLRSVWMRLDLQPEHCWFDVESIAGKYLSISGNDCNIYNNYHVSNCDNHWPCLNMKSQHRTVIKDTFYWHIHITCRTDMGANQTHSCKDIYLEYFNVCSRAIISDMYCFLTSQSNSIQSIRNLRNCFPSQLRRNTIGFDGILVTVRFKEEVDLR